MLADIAPIPVTLHHSILGNLEADFRRSSLSPLTNERVQNLILLLLAPDDGPSFCQASR